LEAVAAVAVVAVLIVVLRVALEVAVVVLHNHF
jgi:hypothetical protein